MKILIYPKNNLWDFVLQGLTNLNNIQCVPLNNACNHIQIINRKLFGNYKLPPFLYLGKDLRNALKNLKEGDSVIVADYVDVGIYSAIVKCASKGVKVYYWIWNPLRGDKKVVRNIQVLKKMGVEIHTFDKKDASMYNLQFDNQFFPIMSNMNYEPPVIEQDFYFVGFAKDRRPLIDEIKNNLSNFRFKFIVAEKNDDCITYEESIENIKRSNCIVEIVQGEQNGLTLRSLESLTFKKKLFTNNKSIINYPFYCHENVFIFGTDDINRIQEFIESPWKEIPLKIIREFDVNEWIKNFS